MTSTYEGGREFISSGAVGSGIVAFEKLDSMVPIDSVDGRACDETVKEAINLSNSTF